MDRAQTTAAPLYAARLTPHRSLGQGGVRLVVAFACALALIPSTIFYLAGAWPVLGFMGLDILALYWALSRSLSETRRSEEVSLWRDLLLVRQIGRRGAEIRSEFNPFWVRFEIGRDGDDRVTSLALASRAARLEIGGFLSPDAKAAFAAAFGTALQRARN